MCVIENNIEINRKKAGSPLNNVYGNEISAKKLDAYKVHKVKNRNILVPSRHTVLRGSLSSVYEQKAP